MTKIYQQQMHKEQTSQKIQKFKWGLYHFQQLFFEISLKKMRSILTKHLALSRVGGETNKLVFKNVYYARSSKRNQQPNKQQQNNPQPEGNQNSQQPQEQNPQQNEKKPKITGPKRLTQLIKSGNPNLIPFYLNYMINNVNHPSLPSPGFKHPKKGKQSKKDKQSGPQQQKGQEKSTTRTEDELLEEIVKNNFRKKPQGQSVEDGVRKEDTKPIHPPQYPFKSSTLYKQRLLKKYKIIQALRSTTKQSQDMQLLSLLKVLKQFDISRLLTDPTHKNLVIRAGIYIMIFFLTFYLAGKSLQKPSPPVDLPFYEPTMSDTEIQSKVNEIKEIKVRPNSHHNNEVTIVLNKEKQFNIFEKIFEVLGFNVQKNQTIKFDSQNPNLILDGLEKVQQNKQNQDWVKIKPFDIPYTLYDAFWDTLFLATPFLGLAITYWIFKKINPDSMLKGITSNKKSMKIESTKDIKVRFKDVAGMENAKKQITEFVDFLKNSEKYAEIGAKIPKGALLTGPPGTGKTMLAKACAGQAGTSFFYVSGSEFVEMFVGVGASRVRELFSKARQEAPSIIFIDEIDAIGKKRQTSRNEEKDSTLNQMLVEMDGFSTNETVIVLAATNRKDVLDSALTRPGRFDRMVEITLPEIKAREQIFMVHLSPLKVNPIKPLQEIAKRLSELTPGFSGADIANLCNEAAIIATRKKRQYIQDADFEQASQRIMAGYIKKGLSNQKTKKRVAYHQSGHAVCGWYLRGGDPLVKLTIIPRSKGALGYAQYLPKTAHIRTKSQLIDQISIMLGGTTSQQVFLGSMSSGNSDDLQKVYRIARSMITQFGMGAKTYNMTLDEQTYVKKESQKLCNLMDEQILEIVNEATNRARQIIEEKRDIVQQLAKQLLEKETINNEDILRIMGERPAFN